MFHAFLPTKFWGHVFMMATYLGNRLPSALLGWKSPFELLHKFSPDYSVLKVFGCLCFATNTKPHKTKFESRASKCIFLGFVPRQKAYTLYDLESQQLITS